MGKLGLLEGKGLFFVNSIDHCYKIKIFFEKFGIKAAVLNAELPLNTRLHTLQEFNRGIFDYLIATDASLYSHSQNNEDQESEENVNTDEDDSDDDEGEEEEEEEDD